MSLAPGAKLGEYRILSRIGRGAYGEVFLAEHVITRRQDAIKVLVDGHQPHEEERFLREIQVQASLHHPNLAEVYTAFPTPQGLALVMELVSGEPLSAVLARGRVPLDVGMGYVLGMLEGLSYAHGRGVVHRDIKPENLVVAANGSVKLTDFGLARSSQSPRLTQTGSFAGSPCYMAPEQALGDESDPRSDTYSAGVLLYEVVTGRLPFQGETAFTVMSEHQSAPPPPPIEVDPAIGVELNRVILKALEKNRDQRFQNAGEFRAALQNVTRAAQNVAPRTQVWPRRLAFTMAACLVLASATLWAVVHHQAAVRMEVAPAPTAAKQASETAPLAVVPEAPPAAEAPSAVEAPAVGEPQPATDLRVTAPPPKFAGKPRKPAPAPTAPLRITGSAVEDPDPPSSRPVRTESAAATVNPPEEHPNPPAAEAPKAPAAPAAQAPASQTVAESPTASEAADPTAGKRRNVVIRTFQRVFHPKPKQ